MPLFNPDLVLWKGKLLLLYDFMPNGSLDKHLYEAPNQTTLNWRCRYRILAGVASALHYLHDEYDQKVVHRDLKASNILLDSEYNARLGDFGLARALDNERNSYAELVLAGVPGTMGYVAPECFHTGRATPESDVYGFGALEVVCSRSPGININHHQRLYSLVDWVWMLHWRSCRWEAWEWLCGWWSKEAFTSGARMFTSHCQWEASNARHLPDYIWNYAGP